MDYMRGLNIMEVAVRLEYCECCGILYMGYKSAS